MQTFLFLCVWFIAHHFSCLFFAAIHHQEWLFVSRLIGVCACGEENGFCSCTSSMYGYWRLHAFRFFLSILFCDLSGLFVWCWLSILSIPPPLLIILTLTYSFTLSTYIHNKKRNLFFSNLFLDASLDGVVFPLSLSLLSKHVFFDGNLPFFVLLHLFLVYLPTNLPPLLPADPWLFTHISSCSQSDKQN